MNKILQCKYVGLVGLHSLAYVGIRTENVSKWNANEWSDMLEEVFLPIFAQSSCRYYSRNIVCIHWQQRCLADDNSCLGHVSSRLAHEHRPRIGRLETEIVITIDGRKFLKRSPRNSFHACHSHWRKKKRLKEAKSLLGTSIRPGSKKCPFS